MSSDSTNASESARSSLERFLVPSGSISKNHSQPQLHRSSHRSSTTDEDISFMDDEIVRLHQDMTNMLASPMSFPTSSARSRALAEQNARQSESEDDYSDHGSLGELKDDLRHTTENLFIRSAEPDDLKPRRASEYLDTSQDSSQPGLTQQQSCNGLTSWEGAVAGAAPKPKSTSCSPDRGGGVMPKPPQVVEGESEAESSTAVYRTSSNIMEMVRESSALSIPRTARSGEHMSPLSTADAVRPDVRNDVAGKAGTLPSRLPRVEDGSEAAGSEEPNLVSLLKDLRARSEEASRVLQALKDLLIEEVVAETMGETPQRKGISVDRLWRKQNGFTHGRQGSHEQHEKTPSADSSMGGDRRKSETEKRMPLLMLAIDHLEQITAGVTDALAGNPGDNPGQVASVPQSPTSQSQSRGGRRRKKVRSSSSLLRRRSSASGHAEPISCGVPRYRVQVGKQGDEVYFEVTITQARSTWTVERRVDEFVALRKALVAAAAEQAHAAAKRRRRSDTSPRSDSSSAAAGGRQGSDAEARVPELNVRGTRWFEKSGFFRLMSGRKREEVLTERQVLLASWLANVLADPELMSSELVRFLGGDDGVLAHPIVEEDDEDAEESDSEYELTEFGETESDGFSGSRFASEEDIWSFNNPPEINSRGEIALLSAEERVTARAGRRCFPSRSSSPMAIPEEAPVYSRIVSQDTLEDRSPGREVDVWPLGLRQKPDLDRLQSSVELCSPSYDDSLKEADADVSRSPSITPQRGFDRMPSLDAFFRAPT